ncbi:MAG TPA: hypothetical protein VFE84_11265, partial [Patescibacteria group bacterium]|nr:hypothetical protein [Patescibacteria group bacterium]
IYPTLLDWAGLPQPPGLQGQSIAGLARGDLSSLERTHVYTQRREPEDLDFSDAAFDGRWKLIRDRAHGRTMLFDLLADPGETLRLEERNPDIVAGLTSKIDAWEAANRSLHEKIRPDATSPLDPETEKQLKSLGYIQ